MDISSITWSWTLWYILPDNRWVPKNQLYLSLLNSNFVHAARQLKHLFKFLTILHSMHTQGHIWHISVNYYSACHRCNFIPDPDNLFFTILRIFIFFTKVNTLSKNRVGHIYVVLFIDNLNWIYWWLNVLLPSLWQKYNNWGRSFIFL